MPRGLPLGGDEIAPLARGNEVLHPAFDDLEPMLVQAQVMNDLRIEQAHRIGGDRIAKAGTKLLGDSRAPDDMPAFEDLNGEARHRQISRAGEAVVAAPDDDDIIGVHETCGPASCVARAA